eukprot:4584745-Prymnesium_polylepis.1
MSTAVMRALNVFEKGNVDLQNLENIATANFTMQPELKQIVEIKTRRQQLPEKSARMVTSSSRAITTAKS